MVHLTTNAAVQTVLVKTVSNLTPTEVFALVDAAWQNQVHGQR